MTIEVRQVCHPEAVSRFSTEELRRHFLIEELFVPGQVKLTYSHIDRLVVGGATPGAEPLTLESHKQIGSPNFLDRRELGVVNLGGAGRVHTDGQVHELAPRDALYVAMGIREVRFESAEPEQPAKFYLISTPAHARFDTVKIGLDRARRVDLGDAANGNVRTIYQMIHPEVCRSAQLVLGMTQLKPGSMWNTMPAHVHDRRSEVYVYFDMKPDTRVFHFMGEPDETKHLVVANEQAILSPGWSIHSGVGTSNYTFVWAMGGDNQDFTDMDMVPMDALR
ncbi:5-dehydro-4-deoxy-D-glucuronate isomerase [Microvirga subterranea]|uniref:4-deoxy-L-threo-5-hexosulose-uronate ketol-isomerase n=1 Tax=Microvirga subterranea TaxID=186651 RepID=A0A370HMW3_9HYPH|nr:5-dehydro-4-deoxy-D-glucuronate isomerase [Microvirga subterranea]RDI59565.1 4-deoxy-L-threo-5-hexulose uronate isomerase [Microvirga subterranea]